MGTIVFPEAVLKIFLTASPEVRARRVMADASRGQEGRSFPVVLAEILDRDFQDETRQDAPLAKASDAILLDTSALSKEEVAQTIAHLWKLRMAEI